jgi:hypothetical protein
MGYSVDKQQSNTFSVQATGFNKASWLDLSGHPRSESMRIRENCHPRSREPKQTYLPRRASRDP